MPALHQSQSQDYSNDQQSLQQQQKVQPKKPRIQRLDQLKNFKKIIINVSMTQYPIVTEVAEELGWKISNNLETGDWDVFWTDFHIEPDVLIKMHLFQKINHYPGIQTLARKNLLGLNLMGMRQLFPQEYDFFPLTWMLPQQYVQFRNYFQSRQKGKTRTYIVKPQADCQGRGIFLTRKLQSIQNGKHYVIQRYISRPFLIDNLKFDMRIYVLLGSVNPLRIYLYEQGLARFATQAYIQPTNSNLQKQYMHLTNYAINKKNPKFIFNTNTSNMNIGHKRSLSCVYKQLETLGVNILELKNKIKQLIVKTIITALPIMSHQYKYSQPQDYTGNMCFHILGFDVMLKSNAQPILLQVNHTPSFTTDTPLDYKIKKNLIKDTITLMNVNIKKKNQLFNKAMQNNQIRLLTGKRNILEGNQREELMKKYEKQREEYENQKGNLGGFDVIYPIKDGAKMDMYKKLIDHANKQYFEEKGSIRMKLAEKQSKRLAHQQYKQRKKTKIGSQGTTKCSTTAVQSIKQPSTSKTIISIQKNTKNTKKSTPLSQQIIILNQKQITQTSYNNQQQQQQQKKMTLQQYQQKTIDLNSIKLSQSQYGNINNHNNHLIVQKRQQKQKSKTLLAEKYQEQVNGQINTKIKRIENNQQKNKMRNVKAYSEHLEDNYSNNNIINNNNSYMTNNKNMMNMNINNINDPYQVYQTYLSAAGVINNNNINNNPCQDNNNCKNNKSKNKTSSNVSQINNFRDVISSSLSKSYHPLSEHVYTNNTTTNNNTNTTTNNTTTTNTNTTKTNNNHKQSKLGQYLNNISSNHHQNNNAPTQLLPNILELNKQKIINNLQNNNIKDIIQLTHKSNLIRRMENQKKMYTGGNSVKRNNTYNNGNGNGNGSNNSNTNTNGSNNINTNSNTNGNGNKVNSINVIEKQKEKVRDNNGNLNSNNNSNNKSVNKTYISNNNNKNSSQDNNNRIRLTRSTNGSHNLNSNQLTPNALISTNKNTTTTNDNNIDKFQNIPIPPVSIYPSYRPNLSGLMTRKKYQQRILSSNKKFTKDNNLYSYNNNNEMNKIIYKGYHANNRAQKQIKNQKYQKNYQKNQKNQKYQKNQKDVGEFVMPKIFCLNFQTDRATAGNNQIQMMHKFFMVKNVDIGVGR